MAGGGWTGVGDRTRRSDHTDVKSKGHSSFAGVVDALNMVGTGTICDKFWVFLNNKHKRCFAVNVHQPAGIEEYLKVDRLTGVAVGDNSTTVFVLAVALDIDHAIEIVK